MEFILANAVSTLVGAILIIASYFIIKNIGRDNFDFWVEVAVLGAEQICRNRADENLGEHKKKLVINFLERRGFKHDEKMDMIIEAHVKRMKLVKEEIDKIE